MPPPGPIPPPAHLILDSHLAGTSGPLPIPRPKQLPIYKGLLASDELASS